MQLRNLMLILALFMSFTNLIAAVDSGEETVLIVSSYNPDTYTVSENLKSFMAELRAKNVDVRVSVENMNCNNLPEAREWNLRLADILSKYRGLDRPSLVIFLGQEAWSAYLSQTNPEYKSLPSMCAMVSRNTVILPNDSVDIRSWLPESKDVRNDFSDFNIVGGIVYEYKIRENIELMKKLYPDINSILFLTDNTFGGVSLQAWIRSKEYKYPDYKFGYLDGRSLTFKDVDLEIANIPENTALFCGTWRVDSSNDYVIGSTTHVLREANPQLPVMTMSSVGLGHWALGGLIPDYHNLGAELADACIAYLDSDRGHPKRDIKIVDVKYVFDYVRMDSLNIDKDLLPKNAEFINKPISPLKEYEEVIWWVAIIFVLLVCGLFIAIYHIRRINRLRKELQKQSEELQVAKENAESANKLKTLFLQNISHEIRTPLNAIVGFSEIISKSADNSMKKYANLIKSNSDYFLKIVNDVMEVAALDSGVTGEKAMCSINELCYQAIDQVKEYKKPGVDFEFVPWHNERSITVPRPLLLSLVVNMLDNAFKFTEKGKVTLRCESIGDGNSIRITVMDTGPGIPLSDQESVFDRFVKLNHFSKGAGLGLSICRNVAKNMHGEIKIDPTYTDGCKIVFTFPVGLQ